MPFVKLDCGILDSSLWSDKPARDIFVTALLMAEPAVYDSPIAQIAISELKPTGWSAPPGWYGFVGASSCGIIRRCGVDEKDGIGALERLGEPDVSSRSNEYEGRRMIRMDGGFIILNYNKYRERDYTGAERQKRWREKHSNALRKHRNTVTLRYITQAEAEAEAEVHTKSVCNGVTEPSGNGCLAEFNAFWKAYPKKMNETEAQRAFVDVRAKEIIKEILAAIEKQKQWEGWRENNGKYIPLPENWLKGQRWKDQQPSKQYRSPL